MRSGSAQKLFIKFCVFTTLKKFGTAFVFLPATFDVTIKSIHRRGDVFPFSSPCAVYNLKHGRSPSLGMFQTSNKPEPVDWVALVDSSSSSSALEAPVRKLMKVEGSGEIPTKGSRVDIKYVGTLLGQEGWSVDDVVDCWLKEQQGLYDILKQPFMEKRVDGSLLMDENIFCEEFVENELGLSNKLQRKKLVMAAKRLTKQKHEFPNGKEFDSSSSRGENFSFIVGEGKVIKAMDLAISTMSIGESAQIVCRADYGYGSEGYRKRNGDIVVPPFATLVFDIKLISIM
eukprot:CAMPEP_0184869076 /NCGR_PEP_ID=MMETSP0580-20130426/32749_1 /TAXON_ID=1118495 /ORGANISM="Dactyliosolen fragilissimus" /LENGTH=286 /DNA_ID=CAMNT_0027370317 /DNA_START=75 /DNA_END=935 /DNA_ORIENTATION=+